MWEIARFLASRHPLCFVGPRCARLMVRAIPTFRGLANLLGAKSGKYGTEAGATKEAAKAL